MKRIRMEIKGRVQGVFFRAFVKEKADSIGIKGIVRNMVNGDVEVIAEGKKEDLKKLLLECKKGSSLSHVEKIDFQWSDSIEEFNDFQIKY